MRLNKFISSCGIAARRKAETLIPLIIDNIEPGTTIVSDEWKGYVSLNTLGDINTQRTHSGERKNSSRAVL